MGKKMKENNGGFTLVELMVSMAMAGIVVAVIYSAYNIQTKIYTEQGKVAEMQQNIRAGLSYLQREGRMAGYNPQREKHATCSAPGVSSAAAPGIHTATATTFGFSMDLNEDGDCADTGENVTYTLYNDDAGVSKLGRNDNTDAASQQPVAENITHIQFVYLFAPPAVGAAVVKVPTSNPNANDFSEIAAVQVALLARATHPDRKAPTTAPYTVPMPDAWGRPTAAAVPAGWPTPDNYNRRLLVTMINCRNMGL
jgi:prepilin-type N-terminal cleavage/methylation domain-containing protein